MRTLPSLLLASAALLPLSGCAEPEAPAGARPASAAEADSAADLARTPTESGPGTKTGSGLAARLSPTRLEQWKLPRRLREISALAVTAAGRVYAIDDERAHVHLLDLEHGEIADRFHVGEPTLRGDFEGLTYARGRFYAITSQGVLYAFDEGAGREHVGFERVETNPGCEIEGLETDPGDASLLLACKRPRERGRVQLLRWWLDAPRLEVVYDEAEPTFADPIDEKDFSPSALAYLPDQAGLIVLAARERSVAQLAATPDGGFELVSVLRLPARSAHRQSEGLAILADGTLLIADEGGDKRARLSRYGADG